MQDADIVNLDKKYLLTVKEASRYTGIGINAIYRKMKEKDCKFVIYVNNRRLIKRVAFERYIEENDFF